MPRDCSILKYEFLYDIIGLKPIILVGSNKNDIVGIQMHIFVQLARTTTYILPSKASLRVTRHSNCFIDHMVADTLPES